MTTKNKNGGVRGRGAYKIADDFDPERHSYGGSTGLREEPQTETDRALQKAREVLRRLRGVVAGR